MVKIGRHIDNYIANDVVILSIERDSELRFCGKCSIATGSILRLSRGAILTFGNKVWIGQGVLIDCNKTINIGDFSSITYNCRLSDSNHHYIWDSDTHTVKNKEGEIKIGKYNWIGNNTTIDKGTYTPDWTIVTHNSILNKKYISDIINNSIILAGSPAKIIGYNKRRIFNSEIEKTINNLFMKFSNSSELIFTYEDDKVEDKFFD